MVAAGESGPGGGGGGMIGGMVSIDLPLSSNERLLRLFSTSLVFVSFSLLCFNHLNVKKKTRNLQNNKCKSYIF